MELLGKSALFQGSFLFSCWLLEKRLNLCFVLQGWLNFFGKIAECLIFSKPFFFVGRGFLQKILLTIHIESGKETKYWYIVFVASCLCYFCLFGCLFLFFFQSLCGLWAASAHSHGYLMFVVMKNIKTLTAKIEGSIKYIIWICRLLENWESGITGPPFLHYKNQWGISSYFR